MRVRAANQQNRKAILATAASNSISRCEASKLNASTSGKRHWKPDEDFLKRSESGIWRESASCDFALTTLSNVVAAKIAAPAISCEISLGRTLKTEQSRKQEEMSHYARRKGIMMFWQAGSVGSVREIESCEEA